MDFGKIDSIQNLITKSKVKFQNDLPNLIYKESLEELNAFSNRLFEKLVKSKTPLEVVAITLDFMVKRLDAKNSLIRNCLEMDLILEGTKPPFISMETEGGADA